MNLGRYLLNIIYPQKNICLLCGQNLLFPEVTGLCSDCLQKIYFVEHYCNVCGRVIGENNSCEYCQKKDWNFEEARGIAEYRGIMKELILHFKYFNQTELVEPLGDILSIYFDYYYSNKRINYIIPVPLHKMKKEIRGYNQAALLADNLQKHTKLPVLDNYLIRKKESPPLYDLGWVQRKKVIKGVFDLRENNINLSGANVILIDDIFTSGSTVNEASNILHNKARVNKIYVLTLATYSNIFYD